MSACLTFSLPQHLSKTSLMKQRNIIWPHSQGIKFFNEFPNYSTPRLHVKGPKINVSNGSEDSFDSYDRDPHAYLLSLIHVLPSMRSATIIWCIVYREMLCQKRTSQIAGIGDPLVSLEASKPFNLRFCVL